jgi:hypothetical protein
MSEEIMKPEVMREAMDADSYKNRLVKLSSDYLHETITETFARMYEDNVEIMRVFSSRKPKKFDFTPEEMDILAGAWLQFRADCAAVALAEEKRLEEAKALAYKIAEESGAITIEEHLDDSPYKQDKWQIKTPALWEERIARSIDHLLAEVQDAQTAYQDFLKLKEEALELIKLHPQIKMRELTNKDNGGKMWKVSVLGTADEWSDHRFKYVLTNIKDAILWLENNPEYQLPSDVCHILKKCPTIKLEKVNDAWHATIPSIPSIRFFGQTLQTEMLLSLVHEERDTYERYQKKQQQNSEEQSDMPPLPASAQLDPALAEGACEQLDAYVDFSRNGTQPLETADTEPNTAELS